VVDRARVAPVKSAFVGKPSWENPRFLRNSVFPRICPRAASRNKPRIAGYDASNRIRRLGSIREKPGRRGKKNSEIPMTCLFTLRSADKNFAKSARNKKLATVGTEPEPAPLKSGFCICAHNCCNPCRAKNTGKWCRSFQWKSWDVIWAELTIKVSTCSAFKCTIPSWFCTVPDTRMNLGSKIAWRYSS